MLDFKKGINVFGGFNGLGAGELAFKRAGIKVNKYISSEVNQDAIKINQKNHPNTIQVGDIKKVDGKKLGKIDVVVGGFPCQGFSTAGHQLNFEDDRSKLFFELERILEETKAPYFLFENVKMDKEVEKYITKRLGVKPIRLNSSLVSAQNRDRLYWTNIPFEKAPNDKKTMLSDVVENGTRCDATSYIYKGKKYPIDQNRRSSINTKLVGNIYPSRSQAGRIYNTCDAKSPIAGYNNCQPIRIVDKDGNVVKMSPVEYERLQTLPDNYTEGVSDCKRYEMINNAWTVDIISHLLKPLKNKEKMPVAQKAAYKEKSKSRTRNRRKRPTKTTQKDQQKRTLTRTDKIVRNTLIGGVSGYIAYRLFKPKPKPPTVGESGNPVFFPATQPLFIRDDPAGSGEYEARRSGVDGAHQGIDLGAISGTNIYAPFSGKLKRDANPYPDDAQYFGILIVGTGIYKGYEMKIFYMVRTIQIGIQFSAGDKIGFAQDISRKWGGGMTDHIHTELRLNGQLIDPTPLFFGNT